MKRSAKLATAIVAMTVGAGSAIAASASHEAVGKVEHINPKSQRITVSHQVYRYSPRHIALDVKRGEKVRVVYRWGHGHRIAEKILPLSSS